MADQITFEDINLSEITTFLYKNYRGETAVRRVVILDYRWGSTEWHPTPGPLLRAFDLSKNEIREFALVDCDFTYRPSGVGKPTGC